MQVDFDVARRAFLMKWNDEAEAGIVSHLTGLEKRMVAIIFDWLAENYTLEM